MAKKYWSAPRQMKYPYVVVYNSGVTERGREFISRHETPERAQEVADTLNKKLHSTYPGNQGNSNTRLLCGYEVLG